MLKFLITIDLQLIIDRFAASCVHASNKAHFQIVCKSILAFGPDVINSLQLLAVSVWLLRFCMLAGCA